MQLLHVDAVGGQDASELLDPRSFGDGGMIKGIQHADLSLGLPPSLGSRSLGDLLMVRSACCGCSCGKIPCLTSISLMLPAEN